MAVIGPRSIFAGHLPYLAIVAIGGVVYLLLRSATVGDVLGFEALDKLREEWNKVGFLLQLYTVIAIGVISAGLGPYLERLSSGIGVTILVLWTVAALFITVLLLATTGIAIDYVPAIMLPALVFVRAIDRQLRRRDRAVFVREMSALQEHALFRSVLDNAYEAIVVANYKGEITYVNRALVLMFGREEDDLIGQKVDVLTPSLFEGRIGQPFSHMLQMASEHRTQVGPFESTGRRRDDSTFPMQVTVGVCSIPPASNNPFERRRGERLFFVCRLVDAETRRRLLAEPEATA